MGCGQSKPATDEEKQAICKSVAKEMLVVFCLEDALKDPSQIQVAAPDFIGKLAEGAAQFRAFAEKVAELGGEDEEEAEEEAPAEEPASGGMFGAIGGMFAAAKEGGAAGLLNHAKEQAMKFGTKAAVTALNGIADGLEGAVDGVEEPMSHIGQEVCTKDRDIVAQAVKDYVKTADIGNACALCWEKENDAITKTVIGEGQEHFSLKLKEVIAPHMKEFPVVARADAALDNFNKGLEKIQQAKDMLEKKGMDIPDAVVPEPIDFDLDLYICQQTAAELCRLMAEAEQKHRDAPEDSASDQLKKVFKKDFDPEVDFLTQSDYKQVMNRDEK